MKQIKIISIVLVSFCFISCNGLVSTTLESNEDNSNTYVFIESSLKKLYISVPKETDSIKVCTKSSEECSSENDNDKNKTTISEVFKTLDDRKIFEFNSTEDIKNFNIERIIKENENIIKARNSSLTLQNSDDKYAPNPEGVELSKDELDMIVEINKYRNKNGRGILIVSKKLMHDSREQSKLMNKYGQTHGLYPNNNAAENIFVTATTVQQAMYGGGAAAYGFTQSPGHNANLLNASYKYLGVGNMPNQPRGCWTQRFAYSN